MKNTVLELTEKLVAVSDFSQGRAGAIFSDVNENGSEYIVLKNNKPTAVVVSISEYSDMKSRLSKYDRLYEAIEDHRLLEMARTRSKSRTTSFEEVIKKDGMQIDELWSLIDSVEIE